MTIRLIKAGYPAPARAGWGVPPAGPLDASPSPRSPWVCEQEAHDMLRNAMAGLPAGTYDRAMTSQLARERPHIAAVAASLIWRARTSIPPGADSYWLGMATLAMRQVAGATAAASLLSRALHSHMSDAERLQAAGQALGVLQASCGIPRPADEPPAPNAA